MSTIYSTSQRNTMKVDPLSGTINVAKPSVSAYSGFLYVTNIEITHGLGKIPAFNVQYEPFGDGTIWPPLGTKQDGYASNPLNLAQSGPGLLYWADNNKLYIQLFYFSNALVGPFPVHYEIYEDFDLS